MEKFLERENVLLGYSPRGSLENSLKPQSRNSEDLDFNDVFGGPPRRFSTQEVKGRYSFSEPVESEEDWIGQKEKPVFGTEVVTRRRYLGDGFFNDIFGGDESNSSPRRTESDRDNPFGSSPGSRISSPGRALTPKAEAFGTSLPPQFSLPAKLTKATDYPTFASGNNRPYNMDGITNGTSSPHSSNSTPSRFSSQALLGQDETRNDVPPVYHHSPLSNEVSFSNEDSTHAGISDQKDVEKWKNDSKSLETPSNNNQFHFSIYKWADRELPMLIPLRGAKIPKLKEMGIDRSASSNGRIKSMERELPTVENHGISTNIGPEFLKFESEKTDDRSTQDSALDMTVKEASSLHETSIGEKIENVVAVKTEESHKPEVKPLHAFIDEFEQKQVKGNLTNLPKGVIPNVHAGKNVKINEGIMDLNRTGMNKASQRTSLINSEKVLGRGGVKGKVKEFVKIFNQDTSSRSKVDPETPKQSSRWKGTRINQTEIEVNLNAENLNEKVPMCSVNKMPDVSHWVNKNLSNDEAKHYSCIKTPTCRSNHFSTGHEDAIPSELLPNDFKVSAENADDPFEDNFVVQELSHDHNIVADGESSEDMKASDVKIQQWSLGKKGNIRSLLSTLQYVLWPESGWKPVPLVDLIEANSVKRSYQKALLCLHPDKLQQKGAASHQKYIAEKVFDILQEAWDHFNTIGL
ncbi:J domain-containing protein required for chloroplast accumulation response 1 [Forsythia ovata]|uniref:J domain-containing protein required for chloroplast accumulation response 1 n=1 Tax=Forsythia ovata TaxID=205694 RepID=A0ABD1P5C4_9LAMI